ncbi:sucrase ferredoxin [Pseudonocardia kongjuensis]|uniref:Sucrase ferredoxin n=1 Tax=Pseudonocardia kongjuensis TaxID=102227 RepID=A0ABN1YBA9_9PSEU
MRGTAAVTRGWLLVEHRGAWGDGGLDRAGAGPGVAIEARCEAAGVRVVLVREPGRSREQGPFRVQLAHSGRAGEWLEELRVTGLDELAGLDPAVTLSPVPPGLGRRVARPRFLVCTHGRKDACCAVFGRPVARALAAGGRVWESTHLGGDRFAPAMVCLPHGVYYGHVDPADAGALARSFDDGLLSLRHLRGRSCDLPEQQVAEHAVRDARGLTGIDDVTPLAVRPGPGSGDGDGVIVPVRHPGGTDTVRVRPAPSAERLTSCTAGEWGRPDPRAVTIVPALAGGAAR